MNIKKLASLLFQRSVIVAADSSRLRCCCSICSGFPATSFMCTGRAALSILAVLIIVSRQTDPGIKLPDHPHSAVPGLWMAGVSALRRQQALRPQAPEDAGYGPHHVGAVGAGLQGGGAEALWGRRGEPGPLPGALRPLPGHTNTYTHYFPLGDDVFPAMLEELRKAEKYIFLEYFIISPGIFWDSMVEILKEKHAAGVDVRVIDDDVGLPEHPAYELRQKI